MNDQESAARDKGRPSVDDALERDQSAEAPARSESAEWSIEKFAILSTAVVALGYAMQWLKTALAPFAVALLFVWAITPFIDFLKTRANFSHRNALGATFALATVILIAAGLMLGSSVATIAENSELYQTQLSATFEYIKTDIIEPIAPGLFEDGTFEELYNTILDALKEIVGELAVEALNFISTGFLIALFALFMLIARKSAQPENQNWAKTRGNIQRYLLVKTIISVLTGATQGIILWGFGVEFPFIFGSLTVALNFVPNFGPIIAVLAPIPIFLISDITLTNALIVLALLVILHFSSGNLIEPRYIGKALDLSPTTILLALIIFGAIWGVMGMFLSTPLTVALKIALESHPYTRPAARLLAGR